MHDILHRVVASRRAHIRTPDDAHGGSHAMPDAAWIGWLKTIKWDWFVTLADMRARGPRASAQQIKEGAHSYVAALRAKAPGAYALVCLECGPRLGGWHAHLLLGGLGTHPSWSRELTSAWEAAYGRAHVVRYDPTLDPHESLRRGAVPYLLKDPTAEVDIVGHLRRHRPRRRVVRPPRHTGASSWPLHSPRSSWTSTLSAGASWH